MYPAPLVHHGINYQSLIYQSLRNSIQTNKIEIPTTNVELPPSYHKTHRRSKPDKYENSSKKSKSFVAPIPNETMPKKHSKPLHTSLSYGNFEDCIQNERKAHTMAPFARITGPSLAPQAKLFASTVAPSATQPLKTNHVSNNMSKPTSSYPKSDIGMSMDDLPPIVVRVQYDGERPSEDVIRKALEKQIKKRANKINDREPIILSFPRKNLQPQLPIPFLHPPPVNPYIRSQLPMQFPQPPVVKQPIRQHPSIRIPTVSTQINPFLPPKAPQPSRARPFLPDAYRPSYPFLPNGNIYPAPPLRPIVKHPQFQPVTMPRLPNREISSARFNSPYTKEHNTFKPIRHGMAAQPTAPYMYDQQNVARRPQTAPSSTEIFRPPAVTDIPELSKDNLLKMLNQIPDLQGREFKIEYAPSGAPEGYPFPSHVDNTGNSYPEPVVIDKLPNNVIQHVKSSNNPALTAALEQTIQQEQYGGQHQGRDALLNPQQARIMHHPAQPHQYVQQSRPMSSDDSDSSSEISSSDSSSSSEETDSEESDNVPSTFQNQYC